MPGRQGGRRGPALQFVPEPPMPSRVTSVQILMFGDCRIGPHPHLTIDVGDRAPRPGASSCTHWGCAAAMATVALPKLSTPDPASGLGKRRSLAQGSSPSEV